MTSIKRQAYQFEREAKQAALDLERERALAKENNSELFNLRELIYTQLATAEDDTSDESSTEAVLYPYTVTHRTVVFGGHYTWSKAIQPKLEGVKFVSKDVNSANKDLIRNADIIWIQPNALSHRLFYPIVNTARKYDVPVRYFTSASAQRCADQLVAGDLSLN